MIFVFQDGISPLYAASMEGYLDVVKILIEAGADVNKANKVGTLTNTRTAYTSI